MSVNDDMNEVDDLGEEALSAEELFEQHQQEIAERFEEKGFFKRLVEMFSGLSKPRNSREYKLAVIDLKRLAAPLLAVLLPTLGVIALIVITEVTGQSKEVIEVEIAKTQADQEDLTEDQPEPEIEPDTPPDETVEITVDTPTINDVSITTDSTPAPSNEPVSVKPAAEDSVAIIKSPVTMTSMAGSRNPGMRGKFTNGGKGYGDASTEAAVFKVLWWLKATQKPDGSWGGGASSLANTALATLTFLAHGETPSDSKYFRETVEKAMQYLVDSQYTDQSGVVRFKGVDGNEYAFLIATYALCETFGMTRNLNTKTAAMKALQRIIDNQSPTGGWDYKMNKQSTRDDLSYAGWALQALKAGKMAGMHPEGLDECIKKAVKCLKTRSFYKQKGCFTYCAAARHHFGLTATGCLAMQLLGFGDQPEVRSALDFMKDWRPAFEAEQMNTSFPTDCPSPQYYCYYAAQCKYQAGMRQGAVKADTVVWQKWNEEMKALYTKSIKTLPQKVKDSSGKEHAQGYYENKDTWSSRPVMDTCLCALQLMVYYRYLPTTKLEAPAANKADDSVKDAVEVEVDI